VLETILSYSELLEKDLLVLRIHNQITNKVFEIAKVIENKMYAYDTRLITGYVFSCDFA